MSVYGRFGYKSYSSAKATASRRAKSSESKAAPTRQRTGQGPSVSAIGDVGMLPPDALKCTNQGEGGPTCGTSLNLMKRLLYSQLAYNPGYASFENGWFDGTSMTPIGSIQAAAKQWMTANPLGVHVAPVALLMDYFQGFVPPRQLVRDGSCRVRGSFALPAEQGSRDEVWISFWQELRPAALLWFLL